MLKHHIFCVAIKTKASVSVGEVTEAQFRHQLSFFGWRGQTFSVLGGAVTLEVAYHDQTPEGYWFDHVVGWWSDMGPRWSGIEPDSISKVEIPF